MSKTGWAFSSTAYALAYDYDGQLLGFSTAVSTTTRMIGVLQMC